MRILIAGQTFTPALNGQSIFCTNLAEGLAKRGHQVVMVAPSLHKKPYRAEQNGVDLHAVRTVHLGMFHPDAYLNLPATRTIQHIFDTFRPEVIHVHDHYPISQNVIRVARQRGIRVLGTNHFMPENLAPYIPLPASFKTFFQRTLWWWMLLTYNHLDIVTGPSRTAVTIMRRNGLKPPAYPISCGVDLNRFHLLPELDRIELRQRYGLDPSRKVFLFVGRVDGEKKIDVLLRAFSLFDRDDIQFAVAGNGAALLHLTTLAQELGLGERVRFTGFIPNDDLPSLLNSADIFTMPSEAELLSIASLEAMACSRPLLLAHAQALPELVDEGVNGYLFKPSNIEDAADNILRLADHPERWNAMGAASLRKVQRHSLENTLRSYEKLYTSLANNPRTRLLTKTPSAPIGKRLRQTISDILE